jgi:hypothetical protein
LFDVRSPLIRAAVPAGALLGAALWLAFGRGTAASVRLDGLAQRLDAARPVGRKAIGLGPDAVALAMAKPLFPLPAGAGGQGDLAVALQGVARSSQRTAALLSFNGAASVWMALGETRDGVTLQDVQADKVVLDTPMGFKEVGLGDASAPASAPKAGPKPAPQPAGRH